MKITILFFSLILIIPFLIHAPVVYAGDCFKDPIYEHDRTGAVTTGVRIRDVACMDGSTVLTTLPVGTTVAITGETDGWWRIKTADGVEGWAGQWLIEASETAYIAPATTVEETTPTTEATPTTPTTTSTSTPTTDRLKGYILLQVENHGEAYYVHPIENVRYYMKDGATAYEMLRKFGLGITDADLAKLQAGDATLKARLKGRILLQVEEHGEAYYVHPKDGSVHYMKDGPAAYQIMRALSLGITNADLNRISERTFEARQENTATNTTQTTADNTSATTEDAPGSIDLAEVNTYWLNRINALRAEKGLRQLVLDDRWIETATRYSQYMTSTGAVDHSRADGSTMHQWIDKQGLDFTERYSTDGWKTNYFTENIAWAYTYATTAGLKKALNDALSMYLAEASTNGAHYRTIYHPDWNSVGAGFSFVDLGNGRYKVYEVFHYGSLQQ